MEFNALVGDVMKRKIHTVGLDAPIHTAAKTMKDKKIGSVVVIGEKNVKGIVTTSDIVYKHVAENKGTKTSDIMTTDLVIVEPNKTIEEAARMMVEKNVEKLLVFDRGKMIGIITNNDILKIEPALFEVLLERMKIGKGTNKLEEEAIAESCEVCGNYADDIEEVDGVYTCGKCRE